MIIRNIPIPETLLLRAEPFTREAFAPFGDAISNPRPDRRPSNTPPAAVAALLPCGAASANQGSAIQYRALASVRELYASAPSAEPATPRLTMFVCGARPLVPADAVAGGSEADAVEVSVLERHPFTSQTFVPLSGIDPAARYLVVVAPTLAPADADADLGLPVPSGGGEGGGDGERLPGRGMPDLGALRAFVATGAQAVTYGAGTWHSPMMALGRAGSAIDFLVFQFANGVPAEDCQEVGLEGKVLVRIEEGDESRESDSSSGGGRGSKL